jgi:pimeloyl-ACP methyl ester carboxylesterase
VARWTIPSGAPPVVLIHGVGFGPETLAPIATSLHARVFARRGYGERAADQPASHVEEHVTDLLLALDRDGVERAVLAGISGGATVALAAALTAPERVVSAIVHEPAVGSLAPALRASILAALSTGGGVGLARFLAGERTWHAMPADLRAWAVANSELIEADADAFARFEPHFDTTAPLICSVGERSPPARYEVAERLAARTGAPVVVVPGGGHLCQLDAPAAFAELIVQHAIKEAVR